MNKPSGLLSVPGRLPEHYDSMWSRLVVDFPEIQVVHRLICRHQAWCYWLLLGRLSAIFKKQFQYRLTHKLYYARVWGSVGEAEGLIDLPLICDWPTPRQKVCFDEGKPSQTRYIVEQQEPQTTLLKLLPITGRSHQLRVHCMELVSNRWRRVLCYARGVWVYDRLAFARMWTEFLSSS